MPTDPTLPTCRDCGTEIESEAEVWPDSTGFPLCQVCWETACSRSWWQAMQAIQESVGLRRKGSDTDAD